MTPEEKRIIQQNLEEVAQILYNNTPDSQLQDFENVELSVREHLMETVAPTIGTFFLTKQVGIPQEERERLKLV